MYASIGLEEIQLRKTNFFILFYWDNSSHAKLLPSYTALILLSIRILWSRHLKSNLYILGENQSSLLVLNNLASNIYLSSNNCMTNRFYCTLKSMSAVTNAQI